MRGFINTFLFWNLILSILPLKSKLSGFTTGVQVRKQQLELDMEQIGKDLFQIGKGVLQGCILPPCLFKLYAEYIMRNAGLNEAQAGI